MPYVELLTDVTVTIALGGAGSLITALYRRKRAAIDEEIWRFGRYMKHDLDCLRNAEAARPQDQDDIAELRRSIRSYGQEAHDLDGRRGMDSLLRQVVADTDLERAYFYEGSADKIWHLIGYESGRASRRGVWVA